MFPSNASSLARRPSEPARRGTRPPRSRYLIFLVEAIHDMHTTGAVAPSGRQLARALAQPARLAGGRLDLLEVGAGTGAVTRELIPLLQPGSRLDIVEPNPRFARELRRLSLNHPHVTAASAAVQVHEQFIQDLRTDQRYDFIISGLPLKNFEPAQVTEILDRCLALLRPGGVFTSFSYVGTQTVRAMVSTRAEATRHRAVEDVIAAYRSRVKAHTTTAWANTPPAVVWQLRAPCINVASQLRPAEIGAG